MGRRSREKGKRGEREAAEALREMLGVDAKRGVQFQGGPHSPDVETDLPRTHFEVKRVARGFTPVYQALEQADADCGNDDHPAVLIRQDGEVWVLALYLQDAKGFIGDYYLYLRAKGVQNESS